MGEGESPTARNNTDDGTAIVLHWLCFVHRSQNQGGKGILAETFSRQNSIGMEKLHLTLFLVTLVRR